MIEIHDHLTDRLNTARLQLELKRSLRPLIVVAFGLLLGLACTFYIARNVARTSYTPTRPLSFMLDDASGIVGGARQELRFKGLQAGTIDSVKLVDGRPVVQAKLFKSFGPIYRDARAVVRPNTVLEDEYVDILDRGHRRAGPASPDDPLLARQTQSSVQPEDVLGAMKPDVRTHMATVLRNLGGGLAGRGASLRTAFAKLVPFVATAGRLSTQLAERDRLTRALVSDTAVLTGELGRRDRAVRHLVVTAGSTLRTLEQRSPQLAATLRELPPTLGAVDSSFAAVRDTVPALNTALDRLQPVAGQLPQSLAAVRRLAGTLDPAARALRRPLPPLTALARALRPDADQLSATAAALLPQTGALGHVTKSVDGCAVALQGFFQWTASLLKVGDSRGGAPGRGDLNLGLDSAAAVSDPNTFVPDSCAPGRPIGGEPGTGGNLRP